MVKSARKKNISKSVNFFLLNYTVQREDGHSKIEPQLKDEIEDGREVPKKPGNYKNRY